MSYISLATVARDRWSAVNVPVTWLHNLGISVLSPVLFSIAFPKFDVGLAALVALTPLFLLWSRMPWQRAFWWGWFSGTLCYALLLYWMAATIFEFVGSWSILVLALVCGIEGLAIAAVAVVASLVGRGAFRTRSIFALPSAWLLFETARSLGSLGVPFGALGHVAAHLPWLLPLAAYGGVYLLTAAMALTNGAIAGIVAGHGVTRKTGFGVLAAVLVLVAAADINSSRPAGASSTVRIAVAQGNIAQRVKWTPVAFDRSLATYSALTRRAASLGARIVIWPETAITSYPLQDPSLLQRLTDLSMKTHVWILAGTLDEPSANTEYNAMLDVTPSGLVGGVYHKHWLIPFVENLPFDRLLRRIPFLDNASNLSPGPGPHLLPAAGYHWGTLICYESAFALYARATANAGADAIIMAADDAWFSGTKEPFEHADITVIEAASTGRWIVRSTQSGLSEVVDPKGNIVNELGFDKRGIILTDVGRGIVTPYDRYGVAWLFALAVIVMAGALQHARREAAL